MIGRVSLTMPLGALTIWTMMRLVIVVLCVHMISNVITFTAVCSGWIFAEREFGPKQSCAKLHWGFFDKTGESWESNLESGLADSSTIQFHNLQPKLCLQTAVLSNSKTYNQNRQNLQPGLAESSTQRISQSSETSYRLIWKHQKHQSMLWFDFWIFRDCVREA